MPEAIAIPRASLIELRRFYLVLSVLLAVLSTIGFWSGYFGPLMTGEVDSPTIIHIHSTVFVGWLALFIAQCAFVASGNIALHRKVGNFGLLWGVVVILTGLATSVVRFAQKLEAGGIEAVEHTLVFPLFDMLLFGVFFGLAARHRFNPELHKRFMIVAASSMLVASVARLISNYVDGNPATHLFTLVLWLSPVLLAMGYEYWRQRLLHPVYLAGGAVILISAYRGPIGETDTWLTFTHWLASVVG